MPSAACVSGLFILDCPMVFVLWIVHSWLTYGFCSLDCSFLIALWFLFSGLFILDWPMVFVLWIIHSWLPYGFCSLDCSFLIAQCCMCLWIVHSWLPYGFCSYAYIECSVYLQIVILYSHSYSNEVYNRVAAWSPMVQRTDEVIVYVDVFVPYFVC